MKNYLSILIKYINNDYEIQSLFLRVFEVFDKSH